MLRGSGNRRMKADSERLVVVDGIVAGIPIRKCDVTQGSYFTGWAILGDSNQYQSKTEYYLDYLLSYCNCAFYDE